MAESKGVNPLATGVAGAIIGAAAAAAAVVLSDEKNRKKAEKILADMQKDGNKIFKEVSRLAMDLKERAEKALPEPKKVSKKATGKSTKKK